MTNKIAKLWAQIAPVKGIVYAVAAHLVCSLVFISFFTWHFHAKLLTVPLHFLFVFCISLVTTLIIGMPLLSKRLRQMNLAKYVIAIIPAAGTTTLIFLYIADYVSNRCWGANINYRLAGDYIFRFPAIVSQLPIHVLWVYIPLIFVIVIVFAVYLFLAPRLCKNLEEMFLPGRPCSLFKNQVRALQSGVGISLFLLLFAVLTHLALNQQHQLIDISQEPVLGFFISTPTFLMDNHNRLLIKLADKASRTAYPREQNFDRKNVIFIIADSLRADHMQLYGYDRPTTPFLSRLAKKSALKKIDMAFSMCAETVCGVMSTLSSKNLTHICSQNFTIYDLLHDQGYETYFILSGSHDWYGMREYYGEEMRFYFDGLDSKRYTLNDDRLIFEGLEQVPDYIGTPAFFYFHLMSPHYSGMKFDNYCNYLPKDKKLEVTSLLAGNYNPAMARNNYDDKVVQTDAVIEQLFDELRKKGYLQNSLVVILGDHGDGLGEHGCFGHIYQLYQEQMRIPILIYDESKFRYPNLKFATQIDVAPTIVDRLGLVPPACWEGASLLKPDLRQYSFHYASPRLERYAVLYRTDKALYKYIQLKDEREERLYELLSDPQENRNLIHIADASLIDALRGQYKENFESNQN